MLVNKQIARFKLLDIIFQIIMFFAAVSLLFIAIRLDWESLAVWYFFAGCQLLSCIGWVVAGIFVPELPRPGRFQIIFLLTGLVVGLAMINEIALFILSLCMVFAGPPLGIIYFIKTCNEHAHYKKLVKLELELTSTLVN